MRRLLVAALVLGLAAPAGAGAAGAWPAPRDGSRAADTLRGSGRADHLRGREGPDRLVGRGGADLLTGDTGGDRADGGPGDDTITGAAGGDDLRGDAGADVILGGFGSDVIRGGSGDDTLDGANDTDRLDGGAGDDLVHGGSGPDLVVGGTGNDRLYADSGRDVVLGGPGRDVLVVDTTTATRVACGPGEDTLYLVQPADLPEDFNPPRPLAYPDCERVRLTDAALDPNTGARYLALDPGGTRDGTTRDDLLLGGPGPDVLRGRGGNDVLWGLRQAGLTSTRPDRLDGGAGDDTIYGGPGPQTIDAGAGDDFVNGGLGRNVIRAGAGRDTVRLRGDGRSTVDAGAGDDDVYVNGPASGRVRCGPGRDTAHANGNDSVARDCERVIVSGPNRPARIRADTTPAGPPYADLVRATPGLTHWWRLGDASPFPDGGQVRDEVGQDDGFSIYARGRLGEPGATDDGDGALALAAARDNELPGSGFGAPRNDDAFDGPAWSFEAWVLTAAAPAARETVFDQDGDPGFSGAPAPTGLRLEVLADGSLAAAERYAGGGVVALVSPPGGLPPDTWHHVVLTRDGVTLTLYLDGVPVASAAVPGPTYRDGFWHVGAAEFGRAPLRGGLDEIAFYDRALDPATVAAHARVGDDGTAPISRATPALPPSVAERFATTLSAARAGARFRCAIDDGPEQPCGPALVVRLPEGPHTLRLRAVDRFGRSEAAPVTRAIRVDLTTPHTIAAAKQGVTNDGENLVAFAADEPDVTFECALRTINNSTAGFRPCTSPLLAPRLRGTTAVRAIDGAGNVDPTPAEVDIKGPGKGFVPLLTGARADASLGRERDLAVPGLRLLCALDDGPPAACASRSRLPVLAPGPHVLRVAQPVPGRAPLVVPPLRWTVPAPAGAVTLAGVQFPAVVESSSGLARRVPRVRLVLDGPARVRLAVLDAAGRTRTSLVVAGVAGANTPKIPARALRDLPFGRYVLTVRAEGPTGAASAERLPFALIPRNR